MTPPDEAPIPISLVAHWSFCPRRAWLESVGERTDTGQVASGTSAHQRTDDPASARGKELRAVDVGHREWNVTGRVDTLEEAGTGWILREYKATPVRRAATVTEAMRIQLALQAACLADTGYEIAGTEIYFTTHNRRIPVELTEPDFREAEAAVTATRSVISSATAPPPLEDSPKCMRCSHSSVCLPDERKLAPVTRRLMAAAPETQIVHLTTPGARASISRGRLIVKKQDETLGDIPIERVLGVQVHGNVDISGALIRELLWRRATIVWCTGVGRVVGWANTGSGPNGLQRVQQHVASAEGRLGIAREFLSSKVANQATQLRRSAGNSPIVKRLRDIQARILAAETWQVILGLEGEAASLYFAAWPDCFKDNLRDSWRWQGRGSRPARDPVNAMLNYAYGMLTSDCIRAVISCGLDPHAGFIHSSNRNKPALALDLMEEFRAPIADSVVMTVINNGEVKPEDFDDRLGTTRLTDRARKAVVAAYERRVQTEFRHPLFDYNVSWRRAIEVQARQVLGVLDGSQAL
jgi:CRISPR-associated protein Cas1